MSRLSTGSLFHARQLRENGCSSSATTVRRRPKYGRTVRISRSWLDACAAVCEISSTLWYKVQGVGECQIQGLKNFLSTLIAFGPGIWPNAPVSRRGTSLSAGRARAAGYPFCPGVLEIPQLLRSLDLRVDESLIGLEDALRVRCAELVYALIGQKPVAFQFHIRNLCVDRR
jgi:hypothetical protein